jgi:hypothetical protein
MSTERVIDNGIEIDSNHYLIKVFNAINQDKTSRIFVYQGVQFWRQDFEFVMSFNGEQFLAGEVVDFDEFKEMLLDQKLN